MHSAPQCTTDTDVHCSTCVQACAPCVGTFICLSDCWRLTRPRLSLGGEHVIIHSSTAHRVRTDCDGGFQAVRAAVALEQLQQRLSSHGRRARDGCSLPCCPGQGLSHVCPICSICGRALPAPKLSSEMFSLKI